MIVQRISPLTGKLNQLDLDITDEQWKDYLSGTLIQDALPNLTADEREFLISGCYPGEYDQLFGEEE